CAKDSDPQYYNAGYYTGYFEFW
nr:immunoglobulin heavy chain junction region [Macaca mulatta]MOW95184.1 immunoglobulin heavy chain junction region [Macaca mulatta]MOW95246.1 immunoglobulin heavy chain junction region [Macaca mulatta]MOW95470.1 immunoglobulin heavy chain junction region [Macaca mulatta]MOW96541.1 immunoglobulin heavy chain junction region [Macaca mulatta]